MRGRSTVGGGVPGVSDRGGDPPGPIPNPVVPTASAGEVLGGQLPGKCGPRARHPAPHRRPPSPSPPRLRPPSRGGAAAARWAHNPKVVGSNPTPATIFLDPSAPIRLDGCFLVPLGRCDTAMRCASNRTREMESSSSRHGGIGMDNRERRGDFSISTDPAEFDHRCDPCLCVFIILGGRYPESDSRAFD